MPVVEVPGVGDVEFPEGTTHEEMTRAINDHVNPPSKTWDFFRSIPRGMMKGAAGAASALGQSEAPQSFMPPEQVAAIPNAEEATRLLEQNVTGSLPRPETGVGRYGETAGEFLGNPGTWLGPGGPAAKAATAIGGALGSEAAGQATEGSRLEPWARFAGGLIGGHAVNAVPRAITPNIIAPERQALINTLQGEGVTGLTAGQRTGSKPLRWAESTLADVPFSGTSAADINEANAGQFTRAALRRVGENSERATPDVIDRALNHNADQFERLTMNSHVNLDAQFGNDITGVAQRYTGTPGLYNPETQNAVTAAIGRIHDLFVTNQGRIPGGEYQILRSDLSRAARGATDPQRSQALREVMEHLDDAMERSMGPHTADAFRQARNEYRNLLVIERAASGGSAEQAGQGFITPSQLATATKAVMGRRAYARGQDEFSDLSRAGQGLMTPLPQSGTAPRENVMHHLQLAGLLGGAGFLAGEAPGAAAGAAAGIALPAVAARGLMSRPVQGYLANQLLPHRMNSSPANIATMNALARALGGGQ